MKLLLDTHALIWWWTNDKRLPPDARAAISVTETYVSAVSVWEMVGKHRSGKLPEADVIVPQFWTYMDLDHFLELPVTLMHAYKGASYPAAHADPFDRLLAAQAEVDRLVLVTRDKAFDAFPCVTRW